MKNIIINKIIWFVGTASALFICFLICRYFAWELYFNRDWAVAMFILGLAIIFITAFFGCKKVMICTAAGYAVSFLAGVIFNFEHDFIVDGVLQDRHNTWWQIWTVVFLVIIVAGIVWEIISNHIKRKANRL